jgi:hypothetical protein
MLLLFANDIKILGGSVSTIKDNRELFVAASRENGLEVNADKTKYMVMSRERNALRGHNVRLIVVLLKGWNISHI